MGREDPGDGREGEKDLRLLQQLSCGTGRDRSETDASIARGGEAPVIHAARLRPNGSQTLFERRRSAGAPQTLAEYETLLAGLLSRGEGRPDGRTRGAKDVHGIGPRSEFAHLERLPQREGGYG